MDYILKQAVLATILYYDVFDYPLTVFEAHRHLINPSRFGAVFDVARHSVSLADIGNILNDLVQYKYIWSRNGFYFLFGRDDIFELRLERQKIADLKIKMARKLMCLLSITPFLRAGFISGSLAMRNTDESSDYDMLLITRSGRLYTCRLLLSAITSLFGVRRTRFEKIAPDKLCFNYFITENGLDIRFQSLYTAQAYVGLKPAYGDPRIFKKFYEQNGWIKKYVINGGRPDEGWYHSERRYPVAGFFRKIAEVVLLTPLGDLFELWAKKYQQKRIAFNPATYESGGRVTFSDLALEFHPRSFEKTVLEKYNNGLARFRIPTLASEEDSGLTK